MCHNVTLICYAGLMLTMLRRWMIFIGQAEKREDSLIVDSTGSRSRVTRRPTRQGGVVTVADRRGFERLVGRFHGIPDAGFGLGFPDANRRKRLIILCVLGNIRI